MNYVHTFSEPTPRFTGVCDRCDTPQQLEDRTTRRASLSRECVACGAPIKVKRIIAKFSDRNCNAECVTATGQQCSCRCGGEKHGTGWAPVVRIGEYVPTDEVIEYRNRAATRREAAERRARERRAAERAERRREFDEWAADHADVIDYVSRPGHSWDFLLDMSDLIDAKSTLSPRQVDVVRNSIKRDQVREAARLAASPVPTGRVEVEGKVVKVSRKKVRRGYADATVFGLTIESADGWRVYVNSPRAISNYVSAELNSNYRALENARVAFTATVSASDDDATFGFASRPVKARVL